MPGTVKLHRVLKAPPDRVYPMRPVEHGEPQSFDSTPTREPVRRMGWDEAVNDGGHFQVP